MISNGYHIETMTSMKDTLEAAITRAVENKKKAT